VMAVIVIANDVKSGFGACAHIAIGKLIEILEVGDSDWTIVTASPVVAFRVALHTLEVGQHVAPTPARQPEIFPAIEFAGITAHVDVSINRTRAAQNATAGPELSTIV